MADDDKEEDDGGVPDWLKAIRREDYEATKDMSPDERAEYYRQKGKEARKRLYGEAQAE